jgi:hypothetical protein
VLAVTLAILIVLGGRHLYWSVALLVLALFAGGYPLRRRLLGETATLPVYLWRSIRSLIGGVGFWFVLLWTPAIVLAIDPARWPLVLVLLALLLWWEHSYQWVCRAAPSRWSAACPAARSMTSPGRRVPPN